MKKIFLFVIAIVAILLVCTACANEIATGILVYEYGEKDIEDMTNNINNMATQAFNAQYDMFFGDAIKGTIVKSMISKVTATSPNITILFEDENGNQSTLTASLIDSNERYVVKANKYDAEGMITEILVNGKTKEKVDLTIENTEE